MKTALVVLNYNDANRCIGVVNYGIENNIFDYYILVDNDSNNEDKEQLRKIQNQKVFVLFNSVNNGYGAGHNAGLKYAVEKICVDYVFVIVSDIQYTKESILSCLSVLENNKDIAAITCRMKNTDGSEGTAAWRRPAYKEYILWCYPFLRKYRNTIDYSFDPQKEYSIVDTVRGSFIGFSATAIKQSGYFDESIFLYNEENALSARLRSNGYKVAILHNHFYIHNHISKQSKPKNFRQLYKESESSIYYMREYENINGLKLAFLKISNMLLVIGRFLSQQLQNKNK